MSFSSDVKNEISALPEERECCRKALLNAAFSFFNTVSNLKIKMNTENASVARYLNLLIKETLGVDALVRFKKNPRNNGYFLEISDPCDIEILGTALGLKNPLTNQVCGRLEQNFSVNECCRKAVVKGAFLSAGSVTTPTKGYHFEIFSHRKKLVEELNEVFLSLGIEPGLIQRGANRVLYLKEKEVIADILNVLGARQMFFKYYDIILEKEMRNQINRKQNFEQANLDKTVNAAVLQTVAIKKLIDKNKFDSLPEHLRNIALLRLNNPQASLSELKELAGESITKSGINHRLKKLTQLGDEL